MIGGYNRFSEPMFLKDISGIMTLRILQLLASNHRWLPHQNSVC
jgi:hypothetical protein